MSLHSRKRGNPLFAFALISSLVVCVIAINVLPKPPHKPPLLVQHQEDEAQKYVNELEGRYSTACNKQITVRWDYITNVTEETAQASVSSTLPPNRPYNITKVSDQSEARMTNKHLISD